MEKRNYKGLTLSEALTEYPHESKNILKWFSVPYVKEKICNRCGKKEKVTFAKVSGPNLIYWNFKKEKWRFDRCYDCRFSYHRNRRKVSKPKPQESLPDGEVKVARFHENRKCRMCKGRLEKSRWWDCLRCKPVLGEELWDHLVVHIGET